MFHKNKTNFERKSHFDVYSAEIRKGFAEIH